MKEIIKICTENKMAEWLRKNYKITKEGFNYFYHNYFKEVRIYVSPFSPVLDDFWLPISFDLKHNCLQIEWLLCKLLKTDLLHLHYFYQKWLDGIVPKYIEFHRITHKSYVLQCLIWLSDLISEGK
ncbi:MAG: hypothetical protein PHY56_00230 [Candidatus Omnitrophica bacterium]|nr:hypothetical protein [Candidatus Omnitrophota bacterium]